MNRLVRTSAGALAVALLACLLLFSGCSPKPEESGTSGSTGTGSGTTAAGPIALRIGVLPTEDSLPLWVAEKNDYFTDAGLPKVEIISFQSAQERDAAFASGAIDVFMGDIIAAANLEAGGEPVTIATVMLGADQSQGRFGIAVAPGSDVQSLDQLADVPVGTSSATIQEYVLDGLMAEAGVGAADVKKEEVKKVPVRYELLMSGKLAAAALPEPFLSLAEKGGARIVGDDAEAERNLTQTVMVFSDKYLAKPGGGASEIAALKAWDAGAKDVNGKPDSHRSLLVEKAGLPEALADSYAINTYPMQQAPARAEVDAVLTWMKDKAYLKADITYSDLVNAGARK